MQKIALTFRDVVEARLGELDFTLVDMTNFFNNAARLCPELIKNRQVTEQIKKVHFRDAFLDLIEVFDSAVEARDVIIANPRSVLEEYDFEVAPIDKKKLEAPKP